MKYVLAMIAGGVMVTGSFLGGMLFVIAIEGCAEGKETNKKTEE